MTSQQFALAIALGYGFSLWMTYEIIKGAVKHALIELKSAEKEAAEKEVQEMTTAKIQD